MADQVIKTNAAMLSALTGAKRIYTDCADHARQVSRAMPDAQVITFSPSVSADNAHHAYSELTPERFDRLEQGAADVADAFRLAFWERDPDLATCLAYSTFDRMHRNLYKAVCLKKDDFSEPVALLQPYDPADPAFCDTFCSPLEALIGARDNVRVLKLDRQLFPDVADPRPPNPGLMSRLGFASWQTIVYRLITMFWEKLRIGGVAGTALVVRENELVKETGLALAFRGLAIKRVSIPSVEGQERAPHPAEVEISAVARQACADAFAPLMEVPALDAVAQCLVADSISVARDYATMTAAWSRSLADLRPKGANKFLCALTNLIGARQLSPLHSAMKEIGAPLCLFQHGVTMEYHATHYRYASHHETASSDIALTFNSLGAEVAARSEYAQGRAVAVGMPRDYTASLDLPPTLTAPPIWYICTALYLGNRGTLLEGVNDGDKCAFETRIVESVLSQLPHKVAYKSYPGRRFFDPLPEELLATAAENITLVRERIDMRYLFKEARILLTSRSFSTPSWCVMSGRPVVYIHIPHQAPLTQEAKAAFSAGLFLFDASEPDFDDRLRAFLSQPIAEIEAAYQEKEAARKQLIKTYFTAQADGAGRRAASALLSQARSR